MVSERRRTGFGSVHSLFIRFVILGLMLTGFTIGLFAVDPANTPEGIKGLYSAGNVVYFWTEDHQGVTVATGPYANGTWDGQHVHFWTTETAGGLGGCVFKSAAYCYFTTTSGELRYVKINPSNGDVLQSPKTIATGVKAAGVAAAVQSGWIYVFTADKTFHSHDGTHYAYAYPPPEDGADAIIDAVTYYPPDGAVPLPDSSIPGATMVLYREGDTLKAERFQVPNFGFSGNPMTLPNPLSLPVARGNLILGTSQGYPSAGAKDPCIQFYGCSDWGISKKTTGYTNYELGRWEYNIKTGQWNAWRTRQGVEYEDAPGIAAAPWFETIDTTSGTMHMYHLIYDFAYDSFTANPSDYEVPMYNDTDYGWEGKPTPTASAANGSNLRNLWTLVGVVLGPPPYPLNGADDACRVGHPLGWVNYGKDTSTTVSTTSTSSSTISIASDTSIDAGIGSADLDLSYAHGWTSSHGTSKTVDVSENFQFGPCSESSGSQGIHGWAIFDAPTLVTQRYKLYAYDYDHSNGSGTYLGQSIYTTSTGAVIQQMTYFELQNPSNGEYNGLFDGMPLYPNSTNVAGWSTGITDWDNGGSDWRVTFGDKTNPQMDVVKLGGFDEVGYTESDTTINSKGNSNSFDVSAGGSIDIAGFSEGLTLGYSGEWETETDHESTITTSVTCGLDVPIPADNSPSDYIKSMTVQPFWLQAKTNKAPWVPKSYDGNLPWCVAWAVTQYSTIGGNESGMAVPPGNSFGTVSNGMGKKDKYTIEGAQLIYVDENGFESPLAMTADDFHPRKGASVLINGYAFKTNRKRGKWKRHGKIWKYHTHKWVVNKPFTLKLDFGNKMWSFEGKCAHLDQYVKLADGSVLVELNLQGTHSLRNWLKSDVDATWHHQIDESEREPTGVHLFDGSYNSTTGTGSVLMKGHFPKDKTTFGDMEVVVNGVPTELPLLSTPGFLEKMESGDLVAYQADGIDFQIDFSTKEWQLNIDGTAFDPNMAPRGGNVDINVRVGGETESEQTTEIQEHLTNLSFTGS